MYIIIVGGGNVGYYLAKTLTAARHEVLLLEKDRLRYRILAEEMGEVVMQGDGCQADQQLEAGFGRCKASPRGINVKSPDAAQNWVLDRLRKAN